MRRWRFRSWVMSLLVVSVVACGSEATSDTDTGDDTTVSCNVEPTLLSLEQNYFKMSCTFTSCHSDTGAQGNLVLTEGNAYDNLIGVAAKHPGAAGADRVVPNDPDASYLIHRVELTSTDGSMPPNIDEPLGLDCQIKALRDWIASGAPKE